MTPAMSIGGANAPGWLRAHPEQAVDLRHAAAEVAAEDRALMLRIGSKDRAAFTVLYDRYSKRAYALAVRILANRSLAEDVIQEVFLAIWRNPSAFDAERASFSSYFSSMVHHKAVDVVRREESLRKRQRSHEVLSIAEVGPPSVESQAWSAIVSAEVRHLLTQIPPLQREVLELAYFEGRTQSEIASLTATPLGTVKTRAAMGMRKLKILLEEAGVLPEPGGGLAF